MSPAARVTSGVDHVGLAVRDLAQTTHFFVETLGFEKVGERPDYPAIFITDGQVMVTLWQVNDPARARPFDRHANIGLHHLALRVGSVEALDAVHALLTATPDVEIEAPPQPLGGGPRRHMMCREPGGIRVEFITGPVD